MAERPPLVGTETPVSRGEPAAPVSEYPTRVSPRAPETSKDVEDARGVLSAYFNAISDSDLDSIYSNITGSFREDRWRKVSTEELREWNERGAVGRYKIREGKKKNGSVQFLVDEHKTGYKPDGTPEERKSVRVYTLVSQNGEWKVNSRQIEKYWKDR